MARFAKLIELEDGEQALVTIEHDVEEDCPIVKVRVDVEGLEFNMKLGFNTEKEAEEMLKKYDIEEAKKFRLAMVNFGKE